VSDELHKRRREAAAFIIAWLAENPTTRRLNTVAACCNWQIEEVDAIIRWVVDQPACSAETALFLLERCGINYCDEEGLRSVEEIFSLCDEIVDKLRRQGFHWAAPPRRDGRDITGIISVPQWADVIDLNYCDLYSQLEEEELPESIKDLFEVLGVSFGERVAKVARKMLIDKGYDPEELSAGRLVKRRDPQG
jgi:hypothetical protein